MRIASMEIITIEASLLILVLLAVRRILAERIHPEVMKWLWVIPALRILIPFQLPLGGLYPVTFNAAVRPLIFGAWVLGALTVFVLFLSQNAGFKRNVKRERTLYGKKDGLLVYFVDRHIGSCLVGLLHPSIYVSKTADNSEEWCKWIMRHELCHYRSMDHWYAVLRLLCLVLQWFNPLVWYAAACSIEDLEITCDYHVVRDEEPDARMCYGQCLIAMAARNPQKLLASITTGNALGKGSLKRRIEYLGSERQRRSITGGIVAVGMVLLLGVCFMVPDNSKNAFVSLLEHVPYVKDCILQYELIEPSKKNLEETVYAMQYRCRVQGLEDIRIYASDYRSVLVVLPPSKVFADGEEGTWSDSFWEDLDYIVYGGSLSLHTRTEERDLPVNQDMFSIERDSEGYSLWLDLKRAMGEEVENAKEVEEAEDAEDAEEASRRMQGLISSEGGLYMGQELICTITDGNVKASMVRLYEGESFDSIYDALERICMENPCGFRD